MERERQQNDSLANGFVGLALDCGPGLTPSDTLRLAKAFEPLHLMWMEDAITGDHSRRCCRFFPLLLNRQSFADEAQNNYDVSGICLR